MIPLTVLLARIFQIKEQAMEITDAWKTKGENPKRLIIIVFQINDQKKMYLLTYTQLFYRLPTVPDQAE